MGARRSLLGAGWALLLCGALTAGCSKKDEGAGSPAAVPQGVYMQVKGKTVNIQGTGCLMWLNKAWSVQIFDKRDDCGKDSTGKENGLSIILDKKLFPPDEKGHPKELPKSGVEYTTDEWVFASESLEDDAASATVKLRVVKIEKPHFEFEVVSYSLDEDEKEKGVEKVGGRVRAVLDDASYWDKLPR